MVDRATQLLPIDILYGGIKFLDHPFQTTLNENMSRVHLLETKIH